MLDWYRTLAELIDLRSFASLWYWIALAAFWFSAGRRVIGVPFDLLTRAHAQGGAAAEEFDTAASIQAARILRHARRFGPAITAVVTCLLALLAVVGFGYGLEIAQAVFFLAFPAAILRAMAAATARRVEAAPGGEPGPRGEALQSLLLWHRFRIQLLGLVFIFATAMWGMWQNLTVSALGP